MGIKWPETNGGLSAYDTLNR